MAQPVTEIAYVNLRSGVDITTPGPGSRVWQEALATISSQDGFVAQRYGLQLENPEVLMLLIDWASLDKHTKFINSPDYKPFGEKLGIIMEGVAFHHIETKPFPPSILTQAPCVELATFYNVEEGFLQNLEAFSHAVDVGKPDGFVGFATGSVVEQITRPKEGAQPGRAAVLLFGWESKEMHLGFRETELFAKHVGLLREKHGGVEMFHVSFKDGAKA